ncbi:hypothetical protein GCM10009422_10910 [Brevundimonas kwangchunensis]|uniref:Peptidase M13 N-terminal domain-containing protein n=1 Tax=Brevundimonas kwangchunensis TaxID=322163 RepID=A0ABN1GS80_9CAUL
MPIRLTHPAAVAGLVLALTLAATAPPAARADTSAAARRVADLRASLTDVRTIEARGLQPLAADLQAIAALADRTAISAWLGAEMRLARPDADAEAPGDALPALAFVPDPDGGIALLPELHPGGPALWVEELLREGAVSAGVLHRWHATHILELTGLDAPAARADRVLALEIALARSLARALADDASPPESPASVVWTRAELEARAPGMDWSAFLTAAGLADSPRIAVRRPQALAALSARVADQPPAVWRDWLTFHHLRRHEPVLPLAFRQAFAQAEEGLLSSVLASPPPRREVADRAVAALLPADLDRLERDGRDPDRLRPRLPVTAPVIRLDEAYANIRRADTHALTCTHLRARSGLPRGRAC